MRQGSRAGLPGGLSRGERVAIFGDYDVDGKQHIPSALHARVICGHFPALNQTKRIYIPTDSL